MRTNIKENRKEVAEETECQNVSYINLEAKEPIFSGTNHESLFKLLGSTRVQ